MSERKTKSQGDQYRVHRVILSSELSACIQCDMYSLGVQLPAGCELNDVRLLYFFVVHC